MHGVADSIADEGDDFVRVMTLPAGPHDGHWRETTFGLART